MLRSSSGKCLYLLVFFLLHLHRSYAAVDIATCSAALGLTLQDCEALVALYENTNGDAWTDNTNWGTASSPWYGVTVGSSRVIFIGLIANGLSGTLPPELGNLDGLSQLVLSSNNLTGSIPPELGNLTSLSTLSLSNNGLTGTIPPELGNMAMLSRLELGANELVGAIPAGVGNLSTLQQLTLSSNSLTGSIPPELGNLALLDALFLQGNQLDGPIPPELGSLSNLRSLWLADNSLTGLLPVELNGLVLLQSFLVQNNQLDADASGNAIIPAVLQSWFDGLSVADISGQTAPDSLSPGKSWRYKVWKDSAP